MNTIEFCKRNYKDNTNFSALEDILYDTYGESSHIIRPAHLCCIGGVSSKEELSKDDVDELSMEYDWYILMGGNNHNGIKLVLPYLDISKTIGLTWRYDNEQIYRSYGIESFNYDVLERDGFKISMIDASPPFTSQQECLSRADDMEYSDILISASFPYFLDYRPDIWSRYGMKGISYYVYKEHVPYIISFQQQCNCKYILKNGTICFNISGIKGIEIW